MGVQGSLVVTYQSDPQNPVVGLCAPRIGVFIGVIVILSSFFYCTWAYGQEVKPDAVADSLNALGQWEWWQILLVSFGGWIPFLGYKYLMKKLDKSKNGNGKTTTTPVNGHVALTQIDKRIAEAVLGINNRITDTRKDLGQVLTSTREIRDNQETNTQAINNLTVEVAKGVGESKKNDGKQFLAIRNLENKVFGKILTTDEDGR